MPASDLHARAIRVFAVVVSLSSFSCFDVSLPPAGRPGSIQGRLVNSEIGRTNLVPAKGGQVRLVGIDLSTAADSEGRFVLGKVPFSTGSLLATSDADGDGQPERQRLISLESIGARPGRDLSLGDLVLSRNALVKGRVLRSDVAEGRGLGGTVIFVAGAPWNARTGDDGSFVLGDLPEGPLQVSLFADGYAASAIDVVLSAGEERVLSPVRLERAAPGVASVTGKVLLATGGAAVDARVRMRGASMTTPLTVDGEGRFQATGLSPGVFSFSIERDGSLSAALLNVLLPVGQTDLGVVTLVEGPSRPLPLETPPYDGGTPTAGGSAGGSSGGGSTAGGSAGGATAGGSTAGGSTAGGSTAGGSTAGGSTAGGSTAGGSTAGGSTAGGSTAGGSTAGGSTAGGSTAGGSSAGGSTAGGSAIDAGSGPVAVAAGPGLVPPNVAVTIVGMASTGAFPLVYRWRQVLGPAVTLSINDSTMAHSPRFTSPAAGSFLEFELIVTDRFGMPSAPVTVRVGVGGPPLARFTPDAGVVFGGQLIPLASTSTEPFSLAVVSYEWQASSGTLVADGGPVAQWRAPPVAFGAPDVLAGITLRVTNSVGGASLPVTNTYIVQGVNPDNWSLDAGGPSPIDVQTTPAIVTLASSVSSGVPSPQYSLNWSCDGGITLVTATSAAPQFLPPTIVGPDVLLSCVLTATGQPPLDPPVLTRNVSMLMRDKAAPRLVSWSVEATRSSPFGYRVTANEPLTAVAGAGGCASTTALDYVVGKTALLGHRNVSPDFTACGPISVQLSDAAPVPNTSASQPVGTGATLITQATWTGPYESAASFADPRPVVAALGLAPEAQQELHGVSPASVPGFEVLATEGPQLVRLTGLDVNQSPSCSPGCPLASSVVLTGLPPGEPPSGTRVSVSGAELIVATSADGGVPVSWVRRSPGGVWSVANGLTGTPNSWRRSLRTSRFSAGQLLLDRMSTDLQSVIATDVVATGLSQVWLAASQENQVFAVTGPTRALLIRERNPIDGTWSTRTPGTVFTGITSVLPLEHFGGVYWVAMEAGAGPTLTFQRMDPPGFGIVRTIGVVQGYDAAIFGQTVYLVFSTNGDVRFQKQTYDMAGGGNPFSDFGGPPRPGFTPPYPVVLDATQSCEAAWPRMAFINEVLVIVWQERCSPATQWKVMARVVR